MASAAIHSASVITQANLYKDKIQREHAATKEHAIGVMMDKKTVFGTTVHKDRESAIKALKDDSRDFFGSYFSMLENSEAEKLAWADLMIKTATVAADSLVILSDAEIDKLFPKEGV